MRVIACPYCGRKHEDHYCIKEGKVLPNDMILVEFCDDERDSDFEFNVE